MMQIDIYTDDIQGHAVWDNGTWTVSPEQFASFVGTVELPDLVPAEVPSTIEPDITSANARIARWTMEWVLREFVRFYEPDSPMELDFDFGDTDVSDPTFEYDPDVVY